MRRARWLLLAAISLIVFAVGSTYYGRLMRMAKEAPAPVEPLKSGIDATAQLWHYRKNDDTKRGPNGEPCPVVEVTARSFSQVQQPASYQLEGVGLKMFHSCGNKFDQVTSAKASFDTSSGVLYSEGDVEILKGLGAEQAPANRLVKIVSSGVYFETKTGKVSTEKAAAFTFENGSGKAVGADYDPNNKQLHMKSQVELNWKGKGPKSEPMKVEAGDVVYFERDSKVTLTPWARLTRGTLKAEGGNSIVTLEDGDVRLVESEKAHGINDDDGRKVEYWAEHMVMQFNDDRQITKVTGDGNAHMISTSDTGITDVKSDHVELALNADEKTSVLDKAMAMGHAVVESKPVVKGSAPPPQTRVLKSEAIDLRMKPGGRDIDSVETHSAGTLEFIPNAPTQPHRFLNGEKFWITYGDDNQIQSFRAVKASTRTEDPPKNGKKQPPVITSSEEFKAEFEPKGNQLARIEQTTNFRYEAGDRKAQADRAVLDQKTDMIVLTGSARMGDPTGNASADRILLNQKSGDFTAEGRVTSTRLPDKKEAAPSAMLSNSEPMQAKANKMVSTDNNLTIHYEGNVVAWQGANRIQADTLDIDRDEGVLHAAGSVVSQFVDKAKKGKDGKPLPQQQTVYTIVKAPELVYTEEQKLADYKGGALMTRPNMTVKGSEIKAYLKDAQSDSSLDHAFAEGSVTIVQNSPKRTRTGTAEHAEYYAGEEKVIMTGGQPLFVDSLKGTTRGKILTYFSNDDRLLVNGVEQQRVESVLHRK
jgi:lipopolysaccharide export system protein LptA